MRGEFTETSGDSSCSRMLMLLLRLGVSNTGRGSDALRASRALLLLSTGVLENCWKWGEHEFQYPECHFHAHNKITAMFQRTLKTLRYCTTKNT
jgi:predicted DNA-binding ArsR family transcriptional regulator